MELLSVNTAKRRFLLGMLKVFYLGLMVVCFGLATALLVLQGEQSVNLSAFFSMRVKLVNFVVFTAVLLVWYVILSACGFYQSKRLATPNSLVVDALIASTLAAMALLAMSKIFRITMVTFIFTLVFWWISSLLSITARVTIRYVLGKIRLHGRNLRQVLILGTNSRAIEFARRIEGRPELGYHVLGFVDDDWPGKKDFQKSGYQLCCDHEGFPDYLRRNVIDEVAIYLPLRSFYEYVSRVTALCEQHGIIMRFASDIFNLKVARTRANDLDEDPYISAFSGLPDGWPILIKRALDMVISVALLVLLAPLFAVVALLIKMESAGPALFQQERIGLNKRRFLIYKFRTMVQNAEKMQAELEIINEAAGPVFKIKDDPRRTRIGGFLRRTSIDELPQLLNVLNGDMSLVGPRPLPVRDYEGFSEDWQRRRFSIRPGITCLWQINGRSSITFEKWMQLDLQYMDEWSLWLDLKILARTVPAVLKGSGAA
jgi:exopolysaccharide biosynthesis polyprenyl glycosylphosphotransferase